MQQSKRQDKLDKAEVIRVFNAGGDVSLLFEPAIECLFAETKHSLDCDTYMVNGRVCTLQEQQQAIAKANLVWVETKSYQSPAGASGRPDNSDSTNSSINTESQNIASNEPEISVHSIEARELRNRSKEYLSEKLKLFSETEKIDLELRKKSVFWMKMQDSI